MTTNFLLQVAILFSLMANFTERQKVGESSSFSSYASFIEDSSHDSDALYADIHQLMLLLGKAKVNVGHEHEDGKWHCVFTDRLRRKPTGFCWFCCCFKFLLIVLYLSVQLLILWHLCHKLDKHPCSEKITLTQAEKAKDIPLFVLN
jgi:hypothetical protein